MTRISLPGVEARDLTLVRQRGIAARLGDYFELIKPKILLLELVTIVVAAQIADPTGIGIWLLLHTVCGAALVAASAGAANQWLERESDARMRRTADRPLPAGRLGAAEVILFSAATLLLGTAQFVVYVGSSTALVGLAIWLTYIAFYTPLKRISPVNTAVGAVSGALPILLGWTATGAAVDLRCLALVSLVFLWQFPHFMAIAWLHRADYARAGHQMLTVVDPSGFRAGAQAMLAALMLLPVSLVPALAPVTGSPTVYCLWALLLGGVQLICAALFWRRRDDVSARRLLRVSILYLSCLMLLLLVVTV